MTRPECSVLRRHYDQMTHSGSSSGARPEGAANATRASAGAAATAMAAPGGSRSPASEGEDFSVPWLPIAIMSLCLLVTLVVGRDAIGVLSAITIAICGIVASFAGGAIGRRLAG